VAVGVTPNPVFRESGLPTGPDGGLLVKPAICKTRPTPPICSAGGDCVYFQEAPLDKVGVYAVRQNPVIYHNLMAALEGTSSSRLIRGGTTC